MLVLPSCKQVAEQVSENIDRPLTGMRWLKMKLHLLMCNYCRRYNEQITLTVKTLKDLEPEQKPSKTLEKNVKESYHTIHCKRSQGDKN